MPFFNRHAETEEVAPPPAPVHEEERHKRHSLFGRNRSPSPSPSHSTVATHSTHRTSTSSDRGAPGKRSLLQRFGGRGDVEMDPSIVNARERVMSAETAERDADRALAAARTMVQEARAEVKRLELEAAEEARLAKIKQFHAKEVSKRGQQLGRHDRM